MDRLVVLPFSRVAQWKRAGPITQRSVDRNHALLSDKFFVCRHVSVIVGVLVARDFVVNRTRKRARVMLRAKYFYLPPTRFIPARYQGLEHFIRNELVDVAHHFTYLGRMEA